MTTVGYGDKSPKSFWGRLFAMLWILIGRWHRGANGFFLKIFQIFEIFFKIFEIFSTVHR